MSNEQAEADFLAKHAAMVYNLALRLSGNRTDAEDLAQDSLLRALKALSGFRGESEASTWLYRITVNTWKNRVRSEKRRSLWKTLPLGLFFNEAKGEEEGIDVKADEPPPDAGLETEETSRAVQEALLTLDPESRAVVVLREIEGLPYDRIAATLGIPEGTVKSRLSRARDELRGKLKGQAKPA